MTPDDSDHDDGRKAEHIAPAVDRTMDHIRHNLAKRVVKRVVVKAAKPSTIVPQDDRRALLRPPAWSPMAAKQAEDRTKRAALVPITPRIATELPIVVHMFRHLGLVFVSRDNITWRATANYDRLVAKLGEEMVRISKMESPPATSMASYDPIYKSLTSPVVLPKGIVLIKVLQL